MDERKWFTTDLAESIGYDEMGEGSVDLLIDYKNGLEDTLNAVDALVSEWLRGGIDETALRERFVALDLGNAPLETDIEQAPDAPSLSDLS